MSNKVVSQTYRSIIDRVINSVRPDFEENGVEDAVLVALQQSWEAKLAMSRVTDFSSDARLGAYQRMLPPEEPKIVALPSTKSNGQVDEDVKPALASGSTSEATPAPSASTSKSSEPPAKSSAADPNSNEINSDLDDSADEDLFSSDDEDGGEKGSANGLGGSDDRGDVIIALYEKVQRVKNKWKITLKDGVISAEGKDYLFNKCQGDFEW